MKSNYKPLGEYIREVNFRNSALGVSTLLGVSIEKKFIPSIANIIGTDMSTYKIVKSHQFAYGPVTSRNGDKISIALLDGYENAMVSQAYSPFEIIDTAKLIPEYLMMWFKRPEFDRYARFMSHGSAREIFSWEEMCNTKFPVPSISTQQIIVKEFNVLANRIATNNKIIRNLEKTAQSLFKQWFVDFEFPNNEGNPYKTNNGKLIESNSMIFPEGWKLSKLSQIATITMGQSPDGKSYNNDKKGMIFYQGRTDFGFRYPDITTYTTEPKRKAKKDDILLSVRAPVGDLNIAIENCCIGRGLAALSSKFKANSHLFYLMQTLKSRFNISNDDGTVFGSINKDDLNNIEVVYSEKIIEKFENRASIIDSKIKYYTAQNKILHSLQELLFTRMSNIDN